MDSGTVSLSSPPPFIFSPGGELIACNGWQGWAVNPVCQKCVFIQGEGEAYQCVGSLVVYLAGVH